MDNEECFQQNRPMVAHWALWEGCEEFSKLVAILAQVPPSRPTVVFSADFAAGIDEKTQWPSALSGENQRQSTGVIPTPLARLILLTFPIMAL